MKRCAGVGVGAGGELGGVAVHRAGREHAITYLGRIAKAGRSTAFRAGALQCVGGTACDHAVTYLGQIAKACRSTALVAKVSQHVAWTKSGAAVTELGRIATASRDATFGALIGQ